MRTALRRAALQRAAGRLPWLALASALGVAALVHGLDRHGALSAMQRPAADALLRIAAQWAPPAVEAPDVSVVAIDAQSLRSRDVWPWPRRWIGTAVDQLDAAGARAIALDIDFSTPRDPADDAALAVAIARSGRVALAAFRQRQVLAGGIELEIANVPTPAVGGAAAGVGSVVLPLDPDARIRRAHRSTPIAGTPMPLLAEVALDLATGGDHRADAPARTSAGDGFRIDFRRSAPRIPVLSIADVLDGRFDPALVRGRTVFVGATAAELQDLWPTPVGPARAGAWIQAVTYRTLVAERAGASVLRDATSEARLAGLLALSLLAALLGTRAPIARLLGLPGLAFLGSGAVAWTLAARGVLFDPIAPALALALHYALGLEVVRNRFRRGLAAREHSLATLFQTAEASSTRSEGNGLDMALALLGEVVGARRVALLRADADGNLDGRRLEWGRGEPGEPALGEPDVAAAVLASRHVRVFEREAPGCVGAGSAVYAPLLAGITPVGVLVVERSVTGAFEALQLRTIATVGMQLALSAENLRLLASLRDTFSASIEAIASAIEARDGYTESHCRRLAVFSSLMATRLDLPPEEIESIRMGALLHDVGKIGIRDDVLLKPGRLTPEERAVMQRHADIGDQIVRPIIGLSATTRTCVRHHHERWDGGGYPDGLTGKEIPLAARIVSIVDVWDALSTERPYKPAMPQEEVLAILRKGAGSQFDPTLVDLFLQILAEEGPDVLALIGKHASPPPTKSHSAPSS